MKRTNSPLIEKTHRNLCFLQHNACIFLPGLLPDKTAFLLQQKPVTDLANSLISDTLTAVPPNQRRMTITDNLDSFNGKKIKDFDPTMGIKQPETYVYRLRINWDEYESGTKVTDLLEAFYEDYQAAEVTELIIGAFDFESNEGVSNSIVESLAASEHKLPHLKALFFGDITYEETEISWIKQCDVSPILQAYPQLEYFRVRGSEGLSLGKLHHTQLKTLIVESGGLPTNVLEEVGKAHLPQLEHLELWLGAENYGFEATVDDIMPILQSTTFPKLTYLGLRDSEISDDIAQALKTALILQQLTTLDLSLGTLGDAGAKALLENPHIKQLSFLDVHHHYISDALVAQLRQLGVEVDASEQKKEEDEGYRYVAVSE